MKTQAASTLMTWNELISSVPGADNDVWKNFCLSHQDNMRASLVEAGIEPTEQKLQEHLLMIFEQEVCTYVKVFKCGVCPQFHIAHIDCIITHAQSLTDEELRESPEDHMELKNVTMAFPVPMEDDMWMYSVHSGIERLAVLKSNNPQGDSELVYIDPQYIDLALALSTQSH